jgi:hypothetical protein
MAAAALPDGSFAIAQQHGEECFYDTITNILMFADVYKDVLVPIAEYCMTLSPDDRATYLINILYGNTNIREDDQALATIIMISIQRFINIRDHGLIRVPRAATNNAKYKLGLVSRINKLPSAHRARAPSMNRSGENAMSVGDESICIDGRRSFEVFEKINRLVPFNGNVHTTRVWNGLLNFIAAHHVLSGPGTPHAIGIIRRNPEYFLVDNELGISIKIPRDIIQLYNGENLSLEFIRGERRTDRIYSIANKVFYRMYSNLPAESVTLTILEPFIGPSFQTYLYEIPGAAAAPPHTNAPMEGGKRKKRLRVTRTASKANRRYSLRKRRSRLYRKI